MAKRQRVEIFHYQCNITGEDFKTTKKCQTPDDLMSIRAYYEMNPEEDDRPEHIKIKLGSLPEKQTEPEEVTPLN